MSFDRRTWLRHIATLRESYPADLPVEVRRVPLADLNDGKDEPHCLGDCKRVGRTKPRYRIRIANTEPDPYCHWLLSHEWAHAATDELTDRLSLEHHSELFSTVELWCQKALGLVD